MTRFAAIALLIAVTGSVAAMDGSVGAIIFVEGSPEIVRDGDVVHDIVDLGFPIQNFDSVRTEELSTVELKIDPATGIDSAITVNPETHLYLNVSSLRSDQVGSIELLNGSIGVVARELTGQSRLQVRTHSSVAGVRGTEFAVTTAVGGEVLISTREGLIEVTDGYGNALVAAPGEAVEIDGERSLMRNVAYGTEELDEFRQRWIDGRLASFQLNAPRILQYYAHRYLDSRRQFSIAYQDLMAYRDIIDRWIEEARRGTVGNIQSLVQDKRRLSGPLVRIQASMFTFEHAAARLDQMASHVRDVSAGVSLGDGGDPELRNAADLYVSINRERTLTRQRLATVRHVFKLFAERNDGLMPTEALDGPGYDDFNGDDGE